MKIYSGVLLDDFERDLRPLVEGLKVTTAVRGINPRGWVQIEVTGEDETVAVHYLEQRFGICPPDTGSIRTFSVFKGLMTGVGKGKNELHVDLGISSPNVLLATVPLNRLQAQLCDGRKLSLQKIVELFGFCENLPLSIRVLEIDLDSGYLGAELPDEQRRQYVEWTRSLLDRLLITGSSHANISRAVISAGIKRDIVKIEPLGMFEHAIVCKFGTDAAGLIPLLGKKLRRAKFTVFNPRKILEFFGSSMFSSI